jgi:TPR repeat protein
MSIESCGAGKGYLTRLFIEPFPPAAAEPETSDEISVGRMYEYGETVLQDYATALHWYQMAAATRDTAAEAGVQRVEQILESRILGQATRS